MPSSIGSILVRRYALTDWGIRPESGARTGEYLIPEEGSSFCRGRHSPGVEGKRAGPHRGDDSSAVNHAKQQKCDGEPDMLCEPAKSEAHGYLKYGGDHRKRRLGPSHQPPRNSRHDRGLRQDTAEGAAAAEPT